MFGAGEGGLQVITAMLRNPQSPYFPVALIDDDPRKQNLRMNGVPVLGTRKDLAAVARKVDADVMVVAIPSATAGLIRELSEVAEQAGLSVRVLPPVAELFGAPIGVSDIRPLTEADLLGRHEIDTDVAAIAGYLTGKRVLVTGAGGSIGSELCRQIYRFAPAELVMLDRDESALHAVQLSIEGRALLDSPNLVVCDIRDADRMREVFAEHRPEVVFHAAALKHLPLLELHPAEAREDQRVGDADAARRRHRQRRRPVRQHLHRQGGRPLQRARLHEAPRRAAHRACGRGAAAGTYLSVRFGNVLGSRGSVLTTFRAQIDAGGPITVTHPDVTRYFMTVEEAVQLVIQAGAIGRGGEVLVLDMGEPVRIADVAHRLAAQAERPIDIVYTGLRPGEKLHEVLLGEGEIDARPRHPRIAQVPVPPLDPATLALDPALDPSALTAAMATACEARRTRDA